MQEQHIKTTILQRDKDFGCIYRLSPTCTGLLDVADHVIPVSAGGLTRESNMVGCCSSCNDYKGAEINPSYLLKAFKHLEALGESVNWKQDLKDMKSYYRQTNIVCVPCGELFRRSHFNQKFCSNRCRQRAFKVGRDQTLLGELDGNSE